MTRLLLVLLTLVGGTAAAGVPDWVPHEQRRVVVTDTSITVFEDFQFIPGSPTFDPKTTHVLDAFAQTMLDHESLQLIVVRTFAADTTPRRRQKLATLRATALVEYFVRRGVARERLRAEGKPLPPAGSKARFEFEIVKRAP